MVLYSAPLQGFTEAPWRRAHNEVFGFADAYICPFIRIENGAVRPKDLRDIAPEANSGLAAVPQIIFRDTAEFMIARQCVATNGYRRIDLNLGCPFPPQVRHGRGCGTIGATDLLREIARITAEDNTIEYSIKMRLGIREADEWRGIVGIINDMSLSHVCVHPRTASQQYGGELHHDEFHAFMKECRHPVIFNGEIRTPDDIDRIADRYPGLKGIMCGRGLLSRPSLFAEWRSGREYSPAERFEGIIRMHDLIFRHYSKVLCGDSQILSKMIPFWEYMDGEIDRKKLKSIRKSRKVADYILHTKTEP